MGTLEFRCEEYDKALQLLNEFVRIRQETSIPNDEDYVNVLFMIGNIHKKNGRDDDAQNCWTEAYEVFQDLGLAEGNPQISQVMKNLVKDASSSEIPDGFQEKVKRKGTGMLGRITSKVKESLREDGFTRGKNRQRGHQL